MDKFQPGQVLHEDPSMHFRTYLAIDRKRKQQHLMKEYTSNSVSETDRLMKSALALARQPHPTWVSLTEVVLQPENRGRGLFMVALVFDSLVSEVPRCIIEASDRCGSFAEGLRQYELRRVIYERKNTHSQVKIQEGWSFAHCSEVVLKTFSPLQQLKQIGHLMTEAIVMARVSHEHTCHILDIAFWSDSNLNLSLVMEKLEKDAQVEITARQTLSSPFTESELLEFLKQVAAALAHAKSMVPIRQGIAHRDIKPANVFFTKEGTYKLGDFGHSWRRPRDPRLFQSERPNNLRLMTRSGAGTPLYLSPEMRSCLVDRAIFINPFASDIYSLGVTLLHLAFLESMLELNTSDTFNLEQCLRRKISELRYSEPLKTLIAKMLEIDPSERPVIEDVNITAKRLLGEENREGNEGNWDYMTPAQLAIEENRVKLALIREEKDYRNELKIADLNAELAAIYKAQNCLRFSETAMLECVHTRQSLLSENHRDTASAYSQLSLIYLATGQFAQAKSFAVKSKSIIILLCGKNHSEAAKAYSVLSLVNTRTGDLRKAEKHAQASLRIQCALFGSSHPCTAISYINLSSVYAHCGRFVEAEDSLLKGLTIQKQLLGSSHPLLATTYTNLANLYFTMGRVFKAEEYARNALCLWVDFAGESSVKAAGVFHVLAKICQSVGKFHEAEGWIVKCLDAQMVSLGDVHPDIIPTYVSLATLSQDTGNLKEAEKWALKAQDLCSRLSTSESIETAIVNRVISSIKFQSGDLESAHQYAQLSLETQKGIEGTDLSSLAFTYNLLALIAKERNMLSQACEYGYKAVDLQESFFSGSSPPWLSTLYSNLSHICFEMKDFRKAELYSRKSLSLRTEILGEEHVDTATERSNLSQICVKLGKSNEAEMRALQAVTTLERLLGGSDERTAVASVNLAYAYYQRGKWSEAARFAEKAAIVLKEKYDRSHSYMRNLRRLLTNIANKQSKLGDERSSIDL